MVRRIVATVLISIVGVAAAPAAFGNPQAPRVAAKATATSVVHLSPVTGKGQLKPGYAVTKKFAAATCNGGSEATGDAYRCFAGKSKHALNRVIDPCWAEGSKGFAICLSAPWSFDVIELTVTKGFHGKPGKKANPLPWGVQLPNGVQCGFSQGAGTAIHGKRVNYGCDNSNLVLYGKVNTSHKTWTIRKATSHGAHFTTHGRTNLAIAWFGKASRKN